MRKLFLIFTLLPALCFANNASIKLESVKIDAKDKESLKNGFELFSKYCSACHGTKYQRYTTVANDLGFTKEQMQPHLPPNVKIGDLMESTMPRAKAEAWLGVAPPDLTLVTRVRGADWVYSYLNGFYKDPTRPLGVNNTVFPLVAMPYVLEPLGGVPIIDHETGKITLTGGSMSNEEYRKSLRDITNYLAYAADPKKSDREALGIKVLAFLLILFVLAFFLKREYWKDVH